jgi:hypothetical protein
MRQNTRAACICLLALLAGGCATESAQTVSVARILADRPAYLRSESFEPNALALPVRQAVAATKPPPSASQRLTLTLDRHVQRNSQQTTARGTLSLEPAGEGLYLVMGEYTSNGVPFRTNFALCYLGIDCLLQQSVMHRMPLPEPIVEATAVKVLTPGKHRPVEGLEYITESEFRIRAGIGTTSSLPRLERHACRAGAFFSANRLHPKLTGEAVELACDISVSGVMQARSRYAVLVDYGVGVEIEMALPEWVARNTVIDVMVEKIEFPAKRPAGQAPSH